jgi:hypothetical protein
MKNIEMFRKLLSEIFRERNAAVLAVDNRDLEKLRGELLKMRIDIDLMAGHVASQLEEELHTCQ